MNSFVIAMPGKDQPQDWTLLDATASDIDPLVDIVRCTMTRARLKVVMRFKAPSWLEARQVFVWKVCRDLKVPKHLLGVGGG
jgi:hypothetical protein